MKYLKNWKLFEASEEEINRILDKILDSGKESLTKFELEILDSFEDFKEDEDDKEIMTLDKDGNMLINNIPYEKYYSDKDDPQFQPPTTPSTQPEKDSTEITNYEYCKKEYNKDNLLLLSNNENNFIVFLHKIMNNKRTYFIYFNKMDVDDKYVVLKIEYDLNIKYDNMKTYDNFNKEIDFEKLQFILKDNEINYKKFNDAWWYIEDDFSNQGYEKQ